MNTKIFTRDTNENDKAHVLPWLSNSPVAHTSDKNEHFRNNFDAWFEKKTQSKELLILETEVQPNAKQPIGVVFLENNNNFFIFLDTRFRNNGIGSKAILLSAKHLTQTLHLKTLVADIPRENTSAIRAFSKARFKFSKAGVTNGRYCQEYIYTARVPAPRL